MSFLLEKLCKIKPLFKKYGMLVQRDIAVVKVFALHLTNLGLIPYTACGPLQICQELSPERVARKSKYVYMSVHLQVYLEYLINLYVILVQRPCESLYYSNFNLCVIEASVLIYVLHVI